ncbi:MAG: endonuclease V [Candidatus Nanoarchaeia archaeon]
MERDELLKKYNIDLEKLEKEQEKLAKSLQIKDKIDFSLCDRFCAIDNTFLDKKILSSAIICTKEYEILDNVYALEKITFPYIPGFRAYRELPAMCLAFNKLNQKPDVVFVPGEGITHARLGLASHFSLAVGIPSIGVSNSIVGCEVKGDDIFKQGKKVGKVLITKEGSRPIYISPGNDISINTAYELAKKFIKLPHKMPEPMTLASKYSKKVKEEVFAKQNT